MKYIEVKRCKACDQEIAYHCEFCNEKIDTTPEDCPLPDMPKSIDDAIAVVEEFRRYSLHIDPKEALGVLLDKLKEAKEQ